MQSDLWNTAPTYDALPLTSTAEGPFVVLMAWASHPSPLTLLLSQARAIACCHHAPLLCSQAIVKLHLVPHRLRVQASPHYGREQLSLPQTNKCNGSRRVSGSSLTAAWSDPNWGWWFCLSPALGQHGCLCSRQLKELSWPETSVTAGGKDEFLARSAH